MLLGIDTRALSIPDDATALEVLAANGVEVMIAAGDEYTPTPVISHAILKHNRGRKTGLADGIVITPSHNPPQDGDLETKPSNGRPADAILIGWIETRANELFESLGRCETGSACEGPQCLHAPDNSAPIGGLEVVTEGKWFAARPSGTENIYKMYAESFGGELMRRTKWLITNLESLMKKLVLNDGATRQ